MRIITETTAVFAAIPCSVAPPRVGDEMGTSSNVLILLDFFHTFQRPGGFGRIPSRTLAIRAGTAHGICVWFDTTLVEGVQFSNPPSAPALVYGHAFFPGPEPVALEDGDTIAILGSTKTRRNEPRRSTPGSITTTGTGRTKEKELEALRP